MDEAGKTRCPHGSTASQLRKEIGKRRRLAATKLQEWWRLLDTPARAGVRTALLRGPRSSVDLHRAANVWRRLSTMRREADATAKARRPRGMRTTCVPCGCSPAGLERERFGRGRWQNFKRVREANAAEKRSARARMALSELDVCA